MGEANGSVVVIPVRFYGTQKETTFMKVSHSSSRGDPHYTIAALQYQARSSSSVQQLGSLQRNVQPVASEIFSFMILGGIADSILWGNCAVLLVVALVDNFTNHAQ